MWLRKRHVDTKAQTGTCTTLKGEWTPHVREELTALQSVNCARDLPSVRAHAGINSLLHFCTTHVGGGLITPETSLPALQASWKAPFTNPAYRNRQLLGQAILIRQKSLFPFLAFDYLLNNPEVVGFSGSDAPDVSASNDEADKDPTDIARFTTWHVPGTAALDCPFARA